MVGHTIKSRTDTGANISSDQINRLELVAIEKVYPHQAPFDGEKWLNPVDGNLRDRSTPKGSKRKTMRWKINTLQRSGAGKFRGHPYTPQIGDLALVAWYGNEKGVILGIIANENQEPVCRPGQEEGCYDQVWKFCPWERPTYDHEGNPDVFPDPHRPFCFKLWDERPSTGKGRDFILCTKCKEGDENPPCDSCTDPGVHQQGHTWLKFLSDNSLSTTDKNDRTKYHHKSGTTFFIDDDGVVYFENRVGEEPKGHWKLWPDGTVEVQSKSVPSGITCGVSGDGSTGAKGARLRVKPSGECELINLEAGAYIKIKADGEIVLHSPSKITLDAPLVEETHDNLVSGNNTIAGSCTHGPCSCPPPGSG